MYWTNKRKVNLIIHAALALLLLTWSVSSSLHFWNWAFQDDGYALGALIVLDGLALLGFMLHIFKIVSPLTHSRHALPLVSAVPLVFDMHGQFDHLQNGYQTWSLTIGLTALLVALSFVVWQTIEGLFISPVEAAKEYAKASMQALHTKSAQLGAMQDAADEFVHTHNQRALLSALPNATYPRLAAYPEPMQASAEPISAFLHNAESMQPAFLHNAEPIVHHAEPTSAFVCMKCSAPVDNAKVRAASSRWGCPNCKEAK